MSEKKKCEHSIEDVLVIAEGDPPLLTVNWCQKCGALHAFSYTDYEDDAGWVLPEVSK